MGPYFFTFGLASIFLLNPIKLSKFLENFLWIAVIIYGTLFIGLREEVGGDWLNYLNSYDKLSALPFKSWFDISRLDPGYLLIVLISSLFDGGIILVNLICGLIVMTSLVFFAKKQPLPWVTIVAAIPFFIIGINMGTVRQGLALSVILVALTYLEKNTFRYLLWVTIAILFHKSAVLMLGLVFFKIRNFVALALLLLATALIAFIFSKLESVEILLLAYLIEPDYQSDGALIRVIVSILPFLGFLIYFKKMQKNYDDSWIYFFIGLGAFALLLLSSSLSTLVDRVAYYTIPLQLALWPRIIAVQSEPLMRSYFTISFILGYLLMLYVWLAYANHSFAWIPYNIFWPGENETTPNSLCLEYISGYC